MEHLSIVNVKKEVVAEVYRAGLELVLTGSVCITSAADSHKDPKETIVTYKQWSKLRVWIKDRLRRAHSLVARNSDPDAHIKVLAVASARRKAGNSAPCWGCVGRWCVVRCVCVCVCLLLWCVLFGFFG